MSTGVPELDTACRDVGELYEENMHEYFVHCIRRGISTCVLLTTSLIPRAAPSYLVNIVSSTITRSVLAVHAMNNT